MTSAAVAAAVAEAHRAEWARVLASTVRVTADLSLAEECVQHAYARALVAWETTGIPARPGAWLTTVARRRALDVLRRESTARRLLPLLVEEERGSADGRGPGPGGGAPDDDRLRLIFTCCHPALAPAAREALTLRLLCGLSTGEVARAFLVSEPTMAARITRAKKKIAAARIPYRVPSPAELPERLEAVLEVVLLVFTTGHTAPAGDDLVRLDLVERSLQLARMLRALLPDDSGVAGLLALILLTDARRPGRLDDGGRPVLLADQDRARWDRSAIAEGLALVKEASARRPCDRFVLMAAIAAVHSEAPSWEDTDWGELVARYDVLVDLWPSPVVALNRAVAVGFARGATAGLAALEEVAAEPQLAGYPYLAVARADLLARSGRLAEARQAYEEALTLTGNQQERGVLLGKLADADRRLSGG